MNEINTQWQLVQGYFLFLYTRLVTRTARWQFEGKTNITSAKASGRPLLWSFWHGQAMPFFSYVDRFEKAINFTLVAVGDDRHNVLGTLGSQLGAKTFAVDMKGNPFAGGRAVLRVIRAMNGGKQSLIAPDGPDGPPYIPKPGVAVIARKAKAAILPAGIWTRHAYQLKRWDRYLVPLPFARIHVAVGEPILVDANRDEESLLDQVSNALHQARTQAQLAAGIEPWR